MKKFLLTFPVLMIFFGSYGQAPLLPDFQLDAWYPFCSSTDVLDRSFNGYDLTSANVTGATDRFGVANKAYSFNGLNSELHYSTFFPIPIFGVQEFSYSVHFYPTAVQEGLIIYNGNPALNGLGLVMDNGLGTGPGNNVSLVFDGTNYGPSFPVTINQWHHALFRRIGNGYILNVDGVDSAFIPAVPPGFTTPTTVFQVGMDITNITKPFSGKIDDIAYYSRQVTTSEIPQIRAFNPNVVFSLGNDSAFCADTLFIGGGITLDTILYPTNVSNPTYGFKYTWSDGDTSSTQHSLIFPPTPTPPVTPSLQLERKYSCPTAHAVTMTHIIPQIDLGPDRTICAGTCTTLNPVPKPLTNYTWSTGATTPSLTVCSTGTFSVVADSASGECIATDEVAITVAPPVVVTLPNDTTLCQGGSVTLSSSNTYIDPSYQWLPPLLTTPAITTDTSGYFCLIVQDGPCRDTDCTNVTIVFDTVTVLSPDTAICLGQTVVARASSDPAITYQWRPTAGMPVSTISTPSIIPDTSAWYVVTATILDCHTSDSFYIDVQPVPIVSLGGNRHVCDFDSVKIVPRVTPAWYTHYSFDWTPGTFLDDSTAPAVVFTAGDTTRILLQVTTPAGCTNADSAFIYTHPGNFASMRTDTTLCPGDSIQLFPVVTEPGPIGYVWNPPTYIGNPLSANPVIKPITSINYTGIISTEWGCKDTVTYDISILPAAVINMDDSALVYPGESYQISPYSNCTYYSWTPSEGLNDSSLSNPIATPPVNTKYILTATTEDGCMAQDSISLRVDVASVIQVPNAFAPGSGINDQLKVILRGIARLRYFRVYDRWGKLVFEGKNISSGWDGTIGGTPQPLGVYVYEVEAVTDAGKILQKQGNVTLLR